MFLVTETQHVELHVPQNTSFTLQYAERCNWTVAVILNGEVQMGNWSTGREYSVGPNVINGINTFVVMCWENGTHVLNVTVTVHRELLIS